MEADVAGHELRCDDPVMRDLRAALVDARLRLKQLAEGPWKAEIGELSEPDEEYLARVERVFRPADV